MWPPRKTLRFKLAMLFLVVFGLILTAVGTAVALTHDRALGRQFDERLLDRSEVMLDEITSRWSAQAARLPVDRKERLNPYRFPGYFLAVRGSDGTVVERSASLAGEDPPLSDTARGACSRSDPILETVRGGSTTGWPAPHQRIRLLTACAETGDGDAFYLQIGADTRSLQRSAGQLRRVLWVMIPLGLAVAGAASWVLAGRSLSPLTRMAEVAERLDASDLSRRFELPPAKDEVAAIVQSMNRLLDRLATAFASQERFLADAAHELKTPLAVLLSEAQVLLQRDRPLEQYTRFVGAVQDEVRSMSETVESLLTLARAEAGVPTGGTSEVSINEAVIDAVTRCSPLADQQEVRLIPTLAAPNEAGLGPQVKGDGALLTLMCANLLRNAIRHSPTEQAVEIGVVTAEARVTVVVRDHGSGIPPEYLDRVFDRFFRVPEPGSSFQGIGLGLTIVKGIAQLHGGEVEVANLPAGGCEFTVRLPTAGPVGGH